MNRQDACQQQEKLQGYLEKRSKMNFWRWWRKYWFVLDGKMLLYYKTKESYELLGRCKGSINMALAQAAQPSCATRRSYPLEIITRTKTVQLSACDEENRQKWLAALQNAIRLPEVSSPIFKRLSSRLSGNVGKYFTDSEPDDVSSADPVEFLEQHAEENEDETDSNLPQALDGATSGKKGKISFRDEETLEETHTIYTACTTERHISTYSFSEVNNTNDSSTRYESSDASTVTLLDEPTTDIKPTTKVKSLAAREGEWSRPRSRSLYEEILDEVLEITGQRLPKTRICNSTGTDNDACGALSINAVEMISQVKAVDEGKFPISDKEDDCSIATPPSSRSSTKCCPAKPPRMSSKKINSKKESSINIRKKVLKTDIDKSRERSFDGDLEVDAYDSANESCYVTAESSDYEGDNSSVNSSNCNLQHHTINACDNLQPQITNSNDNLHQISHSRESLQNQTQPSNGNLQDKTLHSSDNFQDPIHLKDKLQDRISQSSENLQDKLLHSSDNSQNQIHNVGDSIHDQSANSITILIDENSDLREVLQDQNISPIDKLNEVTNDSNSLDGRTTDSKEDQAINLNDRISFHTADPPTEHCEESIVYRKSIVSISLFEPMISSSDGHPSDSQPITSEIVLTDQTNFLSPKPYEAFLESQESLESVKPQSGSLCNMLDVTEDEDDDDEVFTRSPAKLPENSTPHPVTSHNIRLPHFSPINDAPPMKPSAGYSFSVVRSAELVWNYDTPQDKPRKFSQ